MDEDTYIELLNLVTPLIKKQDTVMRKAITPHERLSTTLRFLATGRCMEDLKYSVAISLQALGQIIPETCTAICKVLWRDHLKVNKQFLLLSYLCHIKYYRIILIIFFFNNFSFQVQKMNGKKFQKSLRQNGISPTV